MMILATIEVNTGDAFGDIADVQTQSTSLAWAEMHLMLANLFSRYELELASDAHEAMKWEDRVIMHPHGFLHVKAKARAA
jgi:hypothetical protein